MREKKAAMQKKKICDSFNDEESREMREGNKKDNDE